MLYAYYVVLFHVRNKDNNNYYGSKELFMEKYQYVVANFGQLYSCIKVKIFGQFCCSLYGSPL